MSSNILTDLIFPSCCFRWWSIGLLRYTYALLIFTDSPYCPIFLFPFYFPPSFISLPHHCMVYIKIIWFLLVWYNKRSTCKTDPMGQATAVCPVLDLSANKIKIFISWFLLFYPQFIHFFSSSGWPFVYSHSIH